MYGSVFRWIVTWHNVLPVIFLGVVKSLILLDAWWCCRLLFIPVDMPQMWFLDCCSIYWSILRLLLLSWAHLIPNFFMGKCEEVPIYTSLNWVLNFWIISRVLSPEKVRPGWDGGTRIQGGGGITPLLVDTSPYGHNNFAYDGVNILDRGEVDQTL